VAIEITLALKDAQTTMEVVEGQMNDIENELKAIEHNHIDRARQLREGYLKMEEVYHEAQVTFEKLVEKLKKLKHSCTIAAKESENNIRFLERIKREMEQMN